MYRGTFVSAKQECRHQERKYTLVIKHANSSLLHIHEPIHC